MEMRKNVSPEFVLGHGALGIVGRYARNFAAQKVFVVSDPGVMTAGWTQKVVAAVSQAGMETEVFSGVTSNPRDFEVMAGAERFLTSGCDVIVAVGGGSPIDCAKGIGIVASSGRHILEFEGVDKVEIPGPPLICIPTTAGASADVSQFAVVSDSSRRLKISIISKAMVPDVALIDPVTCTTMPAELTATTGMDALVHAIEAYVSTAGSPLTDLHALEAVRLIGANIEAAVSHPENLVFRDAMTTGSLLAGLAFSNASLGLVHAMAHALGGLMDLPHGECNAVLLPQVVAFNFSSQPARYLAIADALGLTLRGLPQSEQCEKLVGRLISLRGKIGLNRELRALGVDQAVIPGLAQYAHEDACVVTNPIPPTVADIEHIYERSLGQ